MRDPFDPTDAELREWAASDEPWPFEDFDLMVADVEQAPLLLELTSSRKRDFFVSCLYLVVGDAVRSSFNTASRADVEAALEHAAATAAEDAVIRRWIEQSRKLLASPGDFDYETWYEGRI